MASIAQFKESIRQVEAVHGAHTELCSLYVPPSKQPADVLAYLAGELVESSNIKDKNNRKVVQQSIATAAS